jgi:hypothetical protein
MSRIEWQHQLQVPPGLQAQLHDYRRRVWTIKLVEALTAAALSLLVAFLCVLVLDRLWDTPRAIRMAIGVAAAVGFLAIPLFLQRWVWRFRRLDQLAQLLRRKMPRLGDQLLGIIELAENRWEQARSRALCQAAIEQAARDAERCDFRTAMPPSFHKRFLSAAVVLVGIITMLTLISPAATSNAWARLLRPWQDTPRYTFAALTPLPTERVVAHGESFVLDVALADDSAWHPETGRAQLGAQPAVTAKLADGKYHFEFPPQIDAQPLRLRIGDARTTINVEPKLRPELTSIVGKVRLPEYLGQPTVQDKDARGGAVSLVKGSRVQFAATANRPLTEARATTVSTTDPAADAEDELLTVAADVAEPPATTTTACITDNDSFNSHQLNVNDIATVDLVWSDKFGLTSKEPFHISVTALDDEAPQLACEDLPRGRVVLDTEQLKFTVRARDDFGIKEVGMSWRGVPVEEIETPAKGRTLLGAGGFDKDTLQLQGTFTASSLGIEPQPIEVRIFATDYYPDRKQTYTAPFLLYVLNAEQHAMWVTEQLAKWHRQSLEIRDKELQLYETNKELRALSAEELDRPENRRRVENQATAERVNGRRLANLTADGKELLRQASRNPEIGVGHLDKWAEMLQILNDIAANRMPSVAELLKDASQAPRVAAKQGKTGPMAGQSRSNAAGAGKPEDPKEAQKNAAVPRIVDGESSQQPPADPSKANEQQAGGKPSNPTLRLPVTTVMGQGKPANGNKPANETVEQAVTEQRDLLAEFEKIAAELNTILGNLEGSTLVKRLKAASREQYNVAGKIDEVIGESFGKSPSYVETGVKATFTGLTEKEEQAVSTVSYIMDDMAAYFERRRLVQFKTVLDDMRKQDVLGSLRELAGDIPREQGLSISQAEYWSDVMDRWAEDLVDPACSGQCPGCRSKGSLPPSIILEVLQILEAEINLREETRVAEQARAAVTPEKHGDEAKRLSDSQTTIGGRVGKVIDRIRELPDAENEFAKEIALLSRVSTVMGDAAGILAGPETGPPAVAAETEAIELLLQSKRINPKGGGGGGANPGGGGTGTTQDSALALLGAGLNEKEVRENHDTEQASGQSGTDLPEEFRHGLDQYFDRLEERVN